MKLFGISTAYVRIQIAFELMFVLECSRAYSSLVSTVVIWLLWRSIVPGHQESSIHISGPTIMSYLLAPYPMFKRYRFASRVIEGLHLWRLGPDWQLWYFHLTRDHVAGTLSELWRRKTQG